jgi:histidinol-phosphate aminotransferase
VFALEHKSVLDQQAAQLRADRALLYQELAALPGVKVWPSAANFILFRVKNAAAVFTRLREQKVLIKNLAGAGGALSDCLRVTVGTPAENTAFLMTLKKSL